MQAHKENLEVVRGVRPIEFNVLGKKFTWYEPRRVSVYKYYVEGTNPYYGQLEGSRGV